MKQTLAWELRDHGYELLRHYRDPRKDGVRHKIHIGIPGAAYTGRRLDPDEVSEIVHKYIPEAVASDIGSVGMIFIWLSALGAEPRSVGTDYYTQARRAHQTLRKMELESSQTPREPMVD